MFTKRLRPLTQDRPRDERAVRAKAAVLFIAALAMLATIVIPSAATAQSGGSNGDGTCTSALLANINDAKASYSALCGEPYSDTSGFHSCTWQPGGWTCTGPDSTGDGGGNPPGGGDGGTNPPGDNSGGSNGDGTCTSALLANINDAKASYSALCGEPYSDTSGFHSCTWQPGGWTCTGPDSTSGNPPGGGDGGTNPPGGDGGSNGDGTCTSALLANINDAKASYSNICGQPYSDTSGFHSCTWQPGGWTCTGPDSTGGDGGNPPGGGDDLFDRPRDTTSKPAMPTNVRIAGNSLRWEMPYGPLYIYQVTRNSLTGGTPPNWGQREFTVGDGDLSFTDLGGSVRFSIPVGQFSAGDRFRIEAIHPWDISVSGGARSSSASRYAMIQNPGGGQTIGNFLTTFGTPDKPEGSWIGNAGDWKTTPQWSDNFSGNGLLVNRPNPKWYFARSSGNSEITPAPSRNANQTDQRAVLRNGRLEMSARPADGTYSYIGTANNQRQGYVVDPTNGVFVEASVRLDRMTPADNAWWAFWLMAPGNDSCDASGNTTPNSWNAYDGNPRTGTEIDIFEFVPDLGNGFNQAVFRYESQGHNCPDPGANGLHGLGRNFTYEGHQAIPGVDLANYTDGNYHRLGLYYSPDCLAFYMDDEMIWQTNESANPGWVTPTARQSIRLSWEIQDNANPWTSRGGSFANTAMDDDPTVYIDWVNVWEKKASANGLCSGGSDPAQQRTCDGQLVTIDMNTNGGNGLGTAGNDVILGTPGNDTISGRAGNDIICAGAGVDTIFGGTGNDRLFGGTGNDDIYGATGNDFVSGGNGFDDIFGQGGSDSLYGNNGNDLIRGLGANDFIYGGNGADKLFGNGGADRIWGGPDLDQIWGNNGGDFLYGEGTRDIIRGGGGPDVIEGGGGNDDLYGETNTDTLTGGPGTDVFNGGSGADTCSDNTAGEIATSC